MKHIRSRQLFILIGAGFLAVLVGILLSGWLRTLLDLRFKATPEIDRPETIIYLAPASGMYELIRTDPDDGSSITLTSTGGKVYDFSVNSSGQWIAYSVRNESGGLDLWVVNRDGQQAERIVDCGSDECFQPDWSTSSQLIAFTRRRDEVSLPEVWLVNPLTQAAYPLFEQGQAFGEQPLWSPADEALAYLDRQSGKIILYYLNEERQVELPGKTGIPGAWSPDGLSFLFPDDAQVSGGPWIAMYRAQLTGQPAIEAVFTEVQDPVEYSRPEWSPDGDWVAVAVRLMGGNAGHQIWLLSLDGATKTEVTDDPVSNHASYHWDRSGQRLLYQRYHLGSSDSRPEILVWNRESGEAQLLCTDCALPQWAP